MSPPSSSSSGSSSSSSSPPPNNNNNNNNNNDKFLKVGGDRLRRRNRHPHPQQPQQYPPIPRYNPAIYTYMCRGAYHATSDDAKEGGVCNGFKSQLEVLYNEQQESLTRAEALKRFTSMNAEFEFDPTSSSPGGGEGGDNMYGGDLHEQTQAVMISPALIFKDKDLVDNMKQSAEDGNNNNNNPNQRKDPVVVNPILNQHNILPEEELIQRQEWHCYGSTEVEYLVLEDIQTGERKIAAVAPHNTGISRRTIESDDSIRSITRIGLGWLDIIHDNHSIITPSTTPTSEEEAASGPQNKDKELTPTLTPVEVLATAKEAWQRTYNFSTTVAEHMKWNSIWLYENLRDDFPRRTYQAGQKIVTQLPTTIDQTTTTMSQIVGFLMGTDRDDDDNDDDYSGRKR